MNSPRVNDYTTLLDNSAFIDLVNAVVGLRRAAPLPSSCYGPLREHCAAVLLRGVNDYVDPPQWLYLRVSDPHDAQIHSFVNVLRLIDQVVEESELSGTWWLAKHDAAGNAIRLRIPVPDANAKDNSSKACLRLSDAGTNVVSLIYEPELTLFGGAAGLDLAHKHFAVDSRCLLAWFRQNGYHRPCPVGLSFALMTYFLRSAELDPFECMDVWVKVSEKREPQLASPSGFDSSLLNITNALSKILASDVATLPLLFPEALQHVIANCLHDYQVIGREIALTHYQGKLAVGLRSFLCTLILFHWNRAGFPARLQYIAARSAVNAYSASSRLEVCDRNDGVSGNA